MTSTSEQTGADCISGSESVRSGVEDQAPVVLAYLGFLEQQMTSHPELIRPLDAQLIADMDELVGDIEVDLSEDLGDWD
jgi:hypothetical protein